MNRPVCRLGRVVNFAAAVFFMIPLLATPQEPLQSGPVRSNLDWPRGFALGPGDVVGVFVWEHPELSKSAVVAPDGTINFPLIGAVEAAGRSVSDLQAAISTKLGRHLRNPQVTVGLEEVRSYRVFVIGEVLRPGVFELQSAVTVVEAIAMAGGFTPFASRSDILLYNPFENGGSRRVFDYEGFVRGDSDERDIVLRPHDTIIVK